TRTSTFTTAPLTESMSGASDGRRPSSLIGCTGPVSAAGGGAGAAATSAKTEAAAQSVTIPKRVWRLSAGWDDMRHSLRGARHHAEQAKRVHAPRRRVSLASRERPQRFVPCATLFSGPRFV